MADRSIESAPPAENLGEAWNRFWFTPRDAVGLAVLRVLFGTLALYFVVSHTFDLTRWFGPGGLVPISTIESLTGPALFGSAPEEGPQEFNGRFSVFLLTDSPTQLWVLHGLAIICCVFMVLGWKSRIANLLTFVFVISYIHRAPLLASTFEPVLCFGLFYLCLGSSGAVLSLDSRLRGEQDDAATLVAEKQVGANLAIRLIQIHTVAILATMTFTMLGAEQLIVESAEPLSVGGAWWHGSAVWDLLNRTDSRALDLTWLGRFPLVVDAWTHAIVLFQLAFIVLVWFRLTRNWMLLAAIPYWLSIVLLTGQWSFAAAMLVANLAFVSESFWRKRLPTGQRGTSA